MSVYERLARFLRLIDPAETPEDDHETAAVAVSCTCARDPITPPAPEPPEASPRSEPPPKPPELKPYPALSPAPVTSPRDGKLAALTPVLGRRKAGQALWARHLLTEDELRQADRVLRRFR